MGWGLVERFAHRVGPELWPPHPRGAALPTRLAFPRIPGDAWALASQ